MFAILIFLFWFYLTGPNVAGFQVVHIAIGASLSSFFCIILVVCGLYHRKRLQPVRTPPDDNHVEVRYVAASSSCNTTDRLLAIENPDEVDKAYDGSAPTTPTPYTPNQNSKVVHNASTPLQTINKTPIISNKSSYSSPHHSPSIATVNRTSARTPRIQKVSIV